MLKTSFLILTPLLIALIPATIAAIAPPAVVSEANLKAQYILVGKVTAVKAEEDIAHFLLAPIHIIKGVDLLGPDETLRILIGAGRPAPDKLGVHVQGTLPVKVAPGQRVVVYVSASDAFPGYFKPVLEGLSVVSIE